MILYWLEFEPASAPQVLGLGCEITARSQYGADHGGDLLQMCLRIASCRNAAIRIAGVVAVVATGAIEGARRAGDASINEKRPPNFIPLIQRSESAADQDQNGEGAESPYIGPAKVAGRTPSEIGEIASEAGLIPRGQTRLAEEGSLLTQ